MQYLVRTPGPALAPFVEAIWHFEGQHAHVRERILPNGRMQLLVNLHEDELRSYHGEDFARVHRTRGASLEGAFASPFAIDTAEQRHIMGVSFRPGGAFPFFRAPADATAENHLELPDVWGKDGRFVRDRLGETPTPAARLALLERILLERVVRPLEPDAAVACALDAFARDVPIAEVTRRVGLSARSFIRRFSQRIGMTPKRFARVQRFQRVIEELHAGRRVHWASVAAGCGYFDQAHMIHDFRAFSGIRPSEYLTGGTGGRNHVVLE